MASTYLHKLRLFNREVRLYLMTAALIGFAVDGIRGVLFNLYLLRLGYGPEFVGLVSAVGGITFSVLSLPAGGLGARCGLRRALITAVGLVLSGLGLLPIVDWVPTSWQMRWLMASAVLTFAGSTLYFVNGMPFLMSATGPEERNHAFSAQVALAPLAAFAGSLVGGVLPRVSATLLGVSPQHPAAYRYPFLLAALLLLPAVLALLATTEVGPSQGQERAVGTGPAPYKWIGLMALVVLLRLSGRAAVTSFFNVYLDVTLGASTVLIGVIAAAGQLLSVPSALVTPLLVSRWGSSRTIFWGSLGIALSMLPLALIPHWAAAGLGVTGMAALFAMTTAPIRVYSQEIVPPAWRPVMSGAALMAVGLSTAAMSLGGGYAIAALGYRSIFLAGAGLTAVGALLFWAYFSTPCGELAHHPATGTDK
jgi:MFS family permease